MYYITKLSNKHKYYVNSVSIQQQHSSSMYWPTFTPAPSWWVTTICNGLPVFLHSYSKLHCINDGACIGIHLRSRQQHQRPQPGSSGPMSGLTHNGFYSWITYCEHTTHTWTHTYIDNYIVFPFGINKKTWINTSLALANDRAPNNTQQHFVIEV